MLSKISQSEKDKYHMISLMWNLRNKTNAHKEKRERDRERGTNQEKTSNCRNKLEVSRREVGTWVK